MVDDGTRCGSNKACFNGDCKSLSYVKQQMVSDTGVWGHHSQKCEGAVPIPVKFRLFMGHYVGYPKCAIEVGCPY